MAEIVTRKILSEANVLSFAKIPEGSGYRNVDHYVTQVTARVQLSDDEGGPMVEVDCDFNLTPPHEKKSTEFVPIDHFVIPEALMEEIKRWLYDDSVLEGLRVRYQKELQPQETKMFINNMEQIITEEE